MTKITRKLFLSVLTVAFALVTLGATTFAWFTLNTTAEVQTINANLTAGTGIEISLNNSVYKNSITNAELETFIGTALSTYKFDDLTSQNGIIITEMDNTTVVHTSRRYLEFDLWFRSPTQGARVYLLTGTQTASVGVNWTSDASFTYTGRGVSGVTAINAGDSIEIYAADCLRISFEEFEASTTDFSFTSKDSAQVYEFDPYFSEETSRVGENARLGTTIVTTSGMVPYYNQKSDNDIPTATINDTVTLPGEDGTGATLLDQDNLVPQANLSPSEGDVLADDESVAVPLMTLSKKKSETDVFYYGYTKVRIWIEGWDPDCFNAILGKSFSVDLKFGGGIPEPVQTGS